MNKTYLSRKIFARLSLRAAARMICCILTLALWGPARAGAQETQLRSQPQPLNMNNMNYADGNLALTYKLRPGSSTEYAWFYRLGTTDPEQEFSGTLTGVTNSCPTITIKSTKEATASDYTDCATLLLEGVSLSTNTNDNLIEIASGTKPLSIQATGSSDSRLRAGGGGDVIRNNNGGILLLDGGAAGLEINAEGTGSNGIDLYTNNSDVRATLLGKITVETEAYAVRLDNFAVLSAATNAKVTIASKDESAIYTTSPIKVKSPFLQWQFATAPTNGQTLEVKDADGSSFSPAIQFTTNGQKKGFAVNVEKDTGYTLWLGDKQLMDTNGTSVFTATEDKLFSFSDMRVSPTDWSEYAQTADVGRAGTDVVVSVYVADTTYTVKTARGLAWIAWVTNNEKTTANTGETYTASYPASAGFKNCTVTLANDISLAKPAQGAASDFKEDWIPIGTFLPDYATCFQGTFEGNDKRITGMKISSASVVNIGLFGYLYEATVRNLTMASCDIDININSSTADARYLGSVAGWVTKGKIINCHNQCAVSLKVAGKEGVVGGIAGYSFQSVISACSNRGAVTIEGTKGSCGGIVANNYASSIVSCFNTGDITVTATNGYAFAGGIVADCQGNDNDDVISHCYSTGQIKAESVTSASSGGIAGVASYTTIGSCFATGAVSAESNDSGNACAGGILGRPNASDSVVTIRNCLALTTGGVKALGTGTGKLAGRIVGYGQAGVTTLSGNYASTNIQLTVGTTTAAPTDNIGSDQKNGANTDLGNVDDYIASWAGPEDTKAFTAIETFEGGKLPKLKAIAGYGTDGLPATYLPATVIPNQPDLLAADYLAPLPPLALSFGDTETITLSCSNNKWSYKKGANGAETRFNGRIEMQTGSALSTNKLIVATATGNPTLTLDKVVISSTGDAALTVNEGCDLTIAQTQSFLGSSGASTLINKGSLKLSGGGFCVKNTSSSETHYCLDNSGTFSVLDPAGSVTFHCTYTAIHNTGTLANAWMECRFTNLPGASGAEITFNPFIGASSQISVTRYTRTLATTVTAGEEYLLKKNATTESILQKGLDSKGTAVNRFPAPEADGGVATFTEVSDLKTVEISGNQNFSEAGCKNETVIVKPGGVLTIDTENASVFSLDLREGAQVVTTKALKVYRTFTTTRWLNNKWTTFGSPILLTAGVRYSGKTLYAATGYTAEEADSQGWKEVPVSGGERVDLAADSPYLLAAEEALTEVGFNRSTFDTPFEIPATATVASGEALENGVFLFQTNPNLANLTLRGIYVLNDEGTRFERQEQDYVLKPFEAYITANAVTRMQVRSVGVADGSGVTANEIAAATAAVRVWAADGELRVYSAAAAALTVVRSDGRTVYAASIAPGDTRLALPAGIYMIRINNITYKIAL